MAVELYYVRSGACSFIYLRGYYIDKKNNRYTSFARRYSDHQQ